MEKMRTFKRREKGQSLTELAISFMLVMLIFSGAVDFGRAYFELVALRDAAQEGVLYASVYPGDQDGIEDRVQTTSTTPVDMGTTTITITYGPASKGFASNGSDACAGFSNAGDLDGNGHPDIVSNFVTVRVTHVFDFTMPFITAIIGSETIPLSAEQTHTILSPSCP
jgi:hypothetical protein